MARWEMRARRIATNLFLNAKEQQPLPPPLPADWHEIAWQVCAYRCITSYETKTMENFSLCVLQKNNCMSNSAQIPVRPNPTPLARFRGAAVTHETAQDIFMGWLGTEAFSWKVVSVFDMLWFVQGWLLPYHRPKARFTTSYHPSTSATTKKHPSISKYFVSKTRVSLSFGLLSFLFQRTFVNPLRLQHPRFGHNILGYRGVLFCCCRS